MWRKCWNSAFNAQGSRVSIVIVEVRAVKIYVTGKDRMKLSVPPKLSYFVFVRFSFPVTHLMAYYARNWPISPPDHLTLLITLALERKKPWVKLSTEFGLGYNNVSIIYCVEVVIYVCNVITSLYQDMKKSPVENYEGNLLDIRLP